MSFLELEGERRVGLLKVGADSPVRTMATAMILYHRFRLFNRSPYLEHNYMARPGFYESSVLAVRGKGSYVYCLGCRSDLALCRMQNRRHAQEVSRNPMREL